MDTMKKTALILLGLVALLLAACSELPDEGTVDQAAVTAYAGAALALPADLLAGPEGTEPFALELVAPPDWLQLETDAGERGRYCELAEGCRLVLDADAPAGTYTVAFKVLYPGGVSLAKALVLEVAPPPELALDPSEAELTVGEGLRFTVRGDYDGELVWEASCGSVDASGYYVAPDEPGDCTVTVRPADFAGISASATVHVLPPSTGHLTVTVSPSTALVELWAGEEATGEPLHSATGGLDLDLEPGAYHLRASASGYFPVERDLEVVAGDTLEVSLVLSAQPSFDLVPVLELEGEEADTYRVLVGSEPQLAWGAAFASDADAEAYARYVAAGGSPTVTVELYWRTEGQVEFGLVARADYRPGSALLSAQLPPVPAGAGEVRVVVDPEAALPDSYRANNVADWTVTGVGIAIYPDEVTLPGGGAQQFAYELAGEDGGVVWSATCGTVDASGYYIAPDEPGDCTVSVASAADADLKAEATVHVVGVGEVLVDLTPDGASGVLSGPGVYETFTGDRSFTVLPAGHYLLSVSKDGYQPASVEFDLAPGERRELEVRLEVVLAYDFLPAVEVPDAPGGYAPAGSELYLYWGLEVLPPEAIDLARTQVLELGLPGVRVELYGKGPGDLAETLIDVEYIVPGDAARVVRLAPLAAGTTDYRIVVDAAGDIAELDEGNNVLSFSLTGVELAVYPSEVTLAPGDTQQFEAVLRGLDDTAVTWSASCGSVDASGLYTAPASAGTCTVTATSVALPSLSASAVVQVTP